jgi:hypothetical protein
LVAHIPPQVRTSIDQVFQRATRWYDTHPSLKDRIKNVRAENTPGVFCLEKPSSSLFRNFAVLCKWTSIGHYQAALGRAVSADQLVPTEQLVESLRIDTGGNAAFERYFQSVLSPKFIMPIDDPQSGATVDTKSELRRLIAARRTVEQLLPAALKSAERINKIDDELLKAHFAAGLMSAGLKVSPAEFGIKSATKEAVRQVRAKLQDDRQAASAALQPFERAMRERLCTAHRLLRSPEVQAKIRKADQLAQHSEALRRSYNVLRDAHDAMMEFRRDILLMNVLAFNLQRHHENTDLKGKYFDTARDVHRSFSSLRNRLRDEPYPLEHSKQGLTVANYLADIIPPAERVEDLMVAAHHAMDRAVNLFPRILGRLALVAEKVEKIAGLRPMKEPTATTHDNTG